MTRWCPGATAGERHFRGSGSLTSADACRLPCYREAFLRLTGWVTVGTTPPATQTVARPASGDLANTCPQLAATTSGGGGGGQGPGNGHDNGHGTGKGNGHGGR